MVAVVAHNGERGSYPREDAEPVRPSKGIAAAAMKATLARTKSAMSMELANALRRWARALLDAASPAQSNAHFAAAMEAILVRKEMEQGMSRERAEAFSGRTRALLGAAPLVRNTRSL